MARLSSLHLFPALIAAASHAGELTITESPFVVEKVFAASVIPVEPVALQLAVKEWEDFQITRIAPHGSQVAAGDVLAQFDATEIDEKLQVARERLQTGQLALAQAELKYRHLSETVPLRLESLRQSAAHAKEELEYFTKTRRKISEEKAALSLKRTRQLLETQEKELDDLLKIHATDAEKTANATVLRQQDEVAAAEFALRMETLDHERTMKVLLPRQAEILTLTHREAALNLRNAEEELPRELELQKTGLETLRAESDREKSLVAALESDRKLFEFKAPAAGWFYHGGFQQENPEAIQVGHQLPAKSTFATFVPSASKFKLVAAIDEGSARSLAKGLTGVAVLTGREDLEIPVTLTGLAETPTANGSYLVDLDAVFPQGFHPIPGNTLEVILVAYQKPAAIAVPTQALAFGSQGWTVEMKLADGKSERRPVKRGRVSKNFTEILSGLEVGQVIIVP
jgi:HlyD family secretion protein